MKLNELLEIINQKDNVVIFCLGSSPIIKARGNNEKVFTELTKNNSPLLNLSVYEIARGDKHIAIRVPNVPETETKKYFDLTTEQKADFIAELLDTGLVDYYDTCKRTSGGKYVYKHVQTGKTTTMSASYLVKSAEKQWTPEFFAGEWEARQQ